MSPRRWAALFLLPSFMLFGGCSEQGEVELAGQASPDSAASTVVDSVAPPAPPSPRADAPPQIRGLYLNAYAAGSRTRLPRLIAVADTTEINAFVVDVKDERGIRYRTDIELAAELAQDGEVMIRDIAGLADTLRAHNIYSIARIVVFNDPIL